MNQRLINVKVKENSTAPEHDIKIAPICSSNKSQLENDSLGILGPSYRGQPGINDLAVARGAAASLNVKYDLSITIPNPEIFNELFEYSRLISTNSTFLLVYGWNIPDSFNSNTTTRPPNLLATRTQNSNRVTTINLKTGGNGFYEASLVNVYKFDFSFDNVGHLTGKVSFLPEIGSFLVGTRTDSISTGILNQLMKHNAVVENVDEDDNKTYTQEERFQLPEDGSTFRDEFGLTQEDQTIGSGGGGEGQELDILAGMPAFGAELMSTAAINLKFSPNYFFDGLFEDGVTRQRSGLPDKTGKADTETFRIRNSTSVVSVPLVTILPEGQEPAPDAEGTTLTRQFTTSTGQSGTEAKIFIQAQPVYFFLGAVLEAISNATQTGTSTVEKPVKPKVSFIYNDIPVEGTYTVPIPQPTKDQFDSNIENLNAQITDIGNQIVEIDKKLQDNSLFVDEEGKPLSNESEEENTPSPLEQAIQNAQSEKLDLRTSTDIINQQIDSLRNIADGFIENFKNLECANVFDIPVDISRIRSLMSNGNAPLHSMIKQVIDIANDTNPTIKLATRPYNKDAHYIEIYVANLEVGGLSQDIFNSINLGEFGDNSIEVEEKVRRANSALSNKTMVCEFGTERSLVENFSLNAKVDATAFASFRLPAVVGGRGIDLSALVRNELTMNNSSFLGDITRLIEEGFLSSKKQLESLKIITTDPTTGKVNPLTKGQINNLDAFLRQMADPSNVAGRQIVVRLIDELRAADSTFSNSIVAKQNALLMAGSDANPNSNRPSFFGGVLSNFLRRITLTIHGTVGLSTFNLIYVKGLMRGIEGIYQITSVTESLTPASFSTTLECALVNYKDDNKDTNPFAAEQIVSLTQLSETENTSSIPDYATLLAQTERRLADARDANKIKWDG